ncbi:prohormone-2-like [Aphidius gifuensis]|nr:prohormone-2-like [Aphidius gifuensis]
MFFIGLRVFLVGIILVVVDGLAIGLLEDVTKADQVMRPKVKRAQELLMFGNQQNRRPESPSAIATDDLTPSAEKRTLGTSGLEDVKAALADGETFNHQNPKQQITWGHLGESIPQREQNYEYGKVMMNEVNDELPRVWDLQPYPRYFGLDDERRKRSEKTSVPSSVSPTQSTTTTTTTKSPSVTLSPSQKISTSSTQRPSTRLQQSKRSLPLVYQEPRYKRALIDREDLLTLLLLLENQQPRNRNWRNWGNDEYENIEDDGSYPVIEDEDSRGNAQVDIPVYAPRHFGIGSDITPSEIGIPRTHPINSYEQYNNQYTPYENTQYGNAQYGSLYPHSNYDQQQPDKRFMISRKRSQGYDNYSGRNLNDVIGYSQLMNTQQQGYGNYPQGMLY